MQWIRKLFIFCLPENPIRYIIFGLLVLVLVRESALWIGIEKVDFGDDTSMVPTLYPGDRYVLIRQRAYRRFDVVAITGPDNFSWNGDGVPVARQNLVKRIVGMPGETITVAGKCVRIGDHVELAESYFKDGGCGGKILNRVARTSVAPESYYVLGDNRDNSRDSRAFGPIPKEWIYGRVWFVVWPIGHAKIFWRTE